MSTNNGDNRETIEVPGEDSKVLERCLSVEDINNIPSGGGFRGFQKIPAVVLERFDITPYLHTLRISNLGGKVTDKRYINYLLHASRLLSKCSVVLEKQDLGRLKKAVARRESSSSGSDCTDNEAMANFKCKICDKMYSSEKRLQKHGVNKHIVYKPDSKPPKRVSFSDHVIIHEVKEYHKCRKCPKIFEDYKLLKVHMKRQHKKRKCYICNYCNKVFVDRTFFKVHIRLHCDVCGILLPNKHKFNEHRRIVCRVLKLHNCKTCDESYFRFMDLKDHSYEHISVCFVCDICKDQFQTKCAVSHHISFLHSKKRPTLIYDMRNLGTERLYLCNFCEESSVDRDIIEQHTQLLPDLTNRAMTGYKDYYFCDQCLKKFDTETDMLQHKWTHFLKTSDNSQVRPKSIMKKSTVKMTYLYGDPIPDYMKPVVRLDKIKVGGKVLEDVVEFVDVKSFDVNNGEIKKAVVDHKSKKTIISKHQCQTCGKYYSSNYTLNRHIETQHSDYERLRCNVCEESFVWPSLLRSHKCIRLNHPELPFEDARPEIHFDNINEITQNSFDDLNIVENDDYMNSVDFEIPAPIVELTEYGYNHVGNEKCVPSIGYKLIMQEVPIEF